MGRVSLLARMLQKNHHVEIVGALLGESLWQPLVGDDSLLCTTFALRGAVPLGDIRRLLGAVRGDVVYACKPLMTSFGIGLIQRVAASRKLLLDIDDWDRGFIRELYAGKGILTRIRFFMKSHRTLYAPHAFLNAWCMEKLVRCADGITVSNRFLQKKFGGELIWHVRDTEIFRPDRFDRETARQHYGIAQDKKIILFLGTPRPWKGLDDLIDAVQLIKEQAVMLVVVGLHDDPYCRTIIARATSVLGERFLGFGMQPFSAVPKFLAAADVVVIPQKKNAATIGQVPAKVFDAMAMAKPIIGTAVSDMPEILDGCGWIVEPDKPACLATALEYVFAHPREAVYRGKAARQKCVERYSVMAMEQRLENLLQSLGKARQRRAS